MCVCAKYDNKENGFFSFSLLSLLLLLFFFYFIVHPSVNNRRGLQKRFFFFVELNRRDGFGEGERRLNKSDIKYPPLPRTNFLTHLTRINRRDPPRWLLHPSSPFLRAIIIYRFNSEEGNSPQWLRARLCVYIYTCTSFFGGGHTSWCSPRTILQYNNNIVI